MKKFIYSFIAICVTLSAQSQYDPDALEVLNAMSDKYKGIEAFTTNFTQELINKAADINETIEGEITVKGDMYVLKISGQEIYNNGEDIFTFNPEIDEVTVDTYVAENQEITLGNIWDIYREGFKYTLLSTSRASDRTIELSPEDKNKNYHKIRMIIDKENNLKTFTVFEKSGNQYVYTIKNFQKKPNLKDEYFTFDPSKYPNIEVIDFR